MIELLNRLYKTTRETTHTRLYTSCMYIHLLYTYNVYTFIIYIQDCGAP